MNKNYDLNLDILRGICATVVVLRHLVSCAGDFDPLYSITPYIFFYNPPAHLCVLVFFILSGYVIQLNTKQLKDKEEIINYIKKRAIRIFPIYFVVILFTVILTWGRFSSFKILSNFFLLCIPFDNVIAEAAPLWSLHYEVLFYIIFIPIAYLKINLRILLAILLSATVCLFIIYHYLFIHPLFISYLIGFIFWIAGALLAKYKSEVRFELSHSRLLSIVGLIFCLHYFNPYGTFIKILHISEVDYSALSWFQQSISFNDLFFLPLCLILILSLTKKYLPLFNLLLVFLFLSALIRIGMISYGYGWKFLINEHYLIPTFIVLICIILWFVPFNFNKLIVYRIKSLSHLSSVSYAIYIAHLPIFYFFGMYYPSSKSLSQFILKVIIYLFSVYFISYLLEIKYQNIIKKWLNPILLKPYNNKQKATI